ncbi:threonine ammonia-lyase, biosynthetic [Burkholderia sp. AU45274]|uniref:threonine ammonia-lyase, biosynthetic n=1 Tax=Burkholderia sp. AU45274 TaxID=3059205 RepID=UPI0026562CA5|nr:threonine ammonia-lyase, biosynthetic [Burkholderia sp. AU45274]MDN7490972.1 threonine ammonia-lyase, biosynthetic [Burkholderia sp. AU45274]
MIDHAMHAEFNYLTGILNAPVYDVAVKTPLECLSRLSERFGSRVLLKREDMQPSFSFKVRGAYTLMARLSSDALARGVVTASAGNHAQGVALAAHTLGCKASVFMPHTTPAIKVQAVKRYGAEVVLCGDNFDDACDAALSCANDRKRTFVPPFDHPHVIAGQGTVGMEILQQTTQLDAIFVPIGGGGLAAGICAYVKRVKPQIRIFGVEPNDADSMSQALAGGAPVRLAHVGRFCDGVAVRQVGAHSFALCKQYLDGIVLVNNDEVCAAIKDVFVDTRSILEPSGALALAGLKAWQQREQLQGATLVAIASGANMNFDQLRYIAERSTIGEHREVRLAVSIAERPGSFRALIEQLGERVVTAFDYRRTTGREAQVFVGVQTPGAEEAQSIIHDLETAGYRATDLGGSTLWKTYGHQLVGADAWHLEQEKLFQVMFPERRGALLEFLLTLDDAWDISLFHYRNEGFDYGRVLIGIRCDRADSSRLTRALEATNFEFSEQTDARPYLASLHHPEY